MQNVQQSGRCAVFYGYGTMGPGFDSFLSRVYMFFPQFRLIEDSKLHLGVKMRLNGVCLMMDWLPGQSVFPTDAEDRFCIKEEWMDTAQSFARSE